MLFSEENNKFLMNYKPMRDIFFGIIFSCFSWELIVGLALLNAQEFIEDYSNLFHMLIA